MPVIAPTGRSYNSFIAPQERAMPVIAPMGRSYNSFIAP
jgi:hypothetical protein